MNTGLKLRALSAEIQRPHRALSAAGHKIQHAEVECREFGRATVSALHDFQHQLTGVCDETPLDDLHEITDRTEVYGAARMAE